MTWTPEELHIMRTALPIIARVPRSQDTCWPGDGPAHDDDCTVSDHDAAASAVEATRGLSWDFGSWSATAAWMRRVLMDAMEVEIEVDGRYLAVVTDMPGVMAYGDTDEDARRKALQIAVEVRFAGV